ncbi:putative TonB-dependent receptor [Sphingomonas parapaucimobilis NBRC 15100]|uniref:Putative TonB-dependent receptor n=2 Tax=Sphingomonas parapaucimobilis TaxID=28213 RepID=A0A0A1W283_9SPHN|nr:TonB-dependent receptor [Sphingomonas parapaucimobilis]GAL99452.1 putative TonB-dependent receptor [Sphingomonas parapaucimobilis NBRC 15100]
MAAAMPASAADRVSLDLPAGTVGAQVMALGRAARANIVVPDAGLWRRPVPSLRGAFSVEQALAVIARGSGARVEALGPGSWRLRPRLHSPAPKPGPRPRPRPPADVQGEDVVVTASKRDTTRDHFAGQVVQVAGADLELGGAGGTSKLADRMTAIASTYLGAGRNKLFIRGIADSSFTGPTQATVGQYFGDLRLSYNAPDPDLRLADLAAVEVLEGPQGTLYGAGSLGGLIRLVPNAPDPTRFGGSAMLGGSATTNGAPGADAQAVLNLPVIADRLAIRLVADSASEGGYIDKPLLGRTDVNRTRIAGGRAAVKADLGGGWSIEAVGIGQHIRGADSQYADRDGPPLTRSAPVTEGFSANFGQAQLILSGRMGQVRFRSSSGITAHDLMERYDATPPGGPVQLFAQANATRMQANETRAWYSAPDGSGWLAGFSYVHNRTRLTRLFGELGELLPRTGVVNTVEEATLYGEASLRLLPGLLTTGGLRVTRSVLDGEGEDLPLALSLQALARLREVTARRAQTILLPSASALIDLTPGAQLFLRYQQGFRPGGLTIEGPLVRRFRNDRVATIEAGLRSGQPGRDRFDGSLTLAHTAWRDIQADFIDAAGLPSTANIGDGQLWTIEALAGFRIAPGLRVEGAVSYNDSRIDEPSSAQAFALMDGMAVDRATILARLSQIPNIARFTGRAGAVYRRTLASGHDLRVDGWLRYVGSSRLGVGPILGEQQGSYLDSGVTARLGLGRYGVTAGITNLADVRGNRFALGTPFTTGRDQVTPLRPRTLRIGLDAAF